MKKNPKVSLKTNSKKMMEICLIASLLVHVVAFLAFKKFEADDLIIDDVEMVLEVQDIPETEQSKQPPPPAAPAVPIESEDEELLDDLTIDDTDISFADFDDAPPPPKMIVEEDEIPPFLPFEDQPQIIGGLGTLQRLVVYPEIAKRAEIEGRVTIKVLISREGIPTNFQILESLGEACDNAAMAAIRKVKFTPAKQRDKAVPYPMTIPIRFRLK